MQSAYEQREGKEKHGKVNILIICKTFWLYK